MNPSHRSHPAWIEINLAQFKKNIAYIQNKIGSTFLCIPVKAEAYGHGLIPMAQAAIEAGVHYLGVSCLQEGAILREAGITSSILVLGAIHEEQIKDLIHYDLEFTIASRYKAMLVFEESKKLNKKCRVHLEVDTGMQRTGMKPETALNLLKEMINMSCFEIVGLYSHLATADIPNHTFAQQQILEFRLFAEKVKKAFHQKFLFHLANSGGVAHYPESYLDMVRPGLLCLGYGLSHLPVELKNIRPLSLKAKIAYFKVVPQNQGISYGHLYITSKQTHIATIPLGYGDGLRRALSNRASVLIRGKRYPIVGRICMDQCMVDLGQDEAYVGDEVVLIGQQQQNEILLEEMSSLCDTIPYEILCGFSQRLPRRYIS